MGTLMFMRVVPVRDGLPPSMATSSSAEACVSRSSSFMSTSSAYLTPSALLSTSIEKWLLTEIW
uniref:Uncharacterized protein n=1 Tax=Labrus bergylta TaxID=56723 RepID=A0A3Q3LAX6_9LABR